jgi:8-oxo-dGTP diphosphatase
VKSRHVHLVSGAIIRDDECLVVQRGPTMSFSGRWELPGGKVRPGEEPRDALKRELQEELDVRIVVGPLIARGQSHPGLRDFTVEVYEVVLTLGRPEYREHAQHRWIDADGLEDLEWSEPLAPIVEAVRTHLACSQRPTWLVALHGPALDQGAQLASAAAAWTAASLSWMVAASVAWGAACSASLATQQAAMARAVRLAWSVPTWSCPVPAAPPP